MHKRSSTDRDFAVNAFRVVEQAIGEHMDGTPLEDPNAVRTRQPWRSASGAEPKVATRKRLNPRQRSTKRLLRRRRRFRGLWGIGGSFVPSKNRQIGARSEINEDRIGPSFGLVVFLDLGSKATRLGAHDRFLARMIWGFAVYTSTPIRYSLRESPRPAMAVSTVKRRNLASRSELTKGERCKTRASSARISCSEQVSSVGSLSKVQRSSGTLDGY